MGKIKRAVLIMILLILVLKLTPNGVNMASARNTDKNPTRISGVYINEIGKDYIVISWSTNHTTINNKVNYGIDLTYGGEAWSSDYERQHLVKINNLKPDTKYLFEVMSQGNNYVYDAYYSFVTKK